MYSFETKTDYEIHVKRSDVMPDDLIILVIDGEAYALTPHDAASLGYVLTTYAKGEEGALER